MLPEIRRKEQQTYYEVQACVKRFETKKEALQKALELSVGKEKGKLTYVYKVVNTKHFGDISGYADKVILANTSKSLAVAVMPRESLAVENGWIDYE